MVISGIRVRGLARTLVKDIDIRCSDVVVRIFPSHGFPSWITFFLLNFPIPQGILYLGPHIKQLFEGGNQYKIYDLIVSRLQVQDYHVNMFLIYGSIGHLGYVLPPTGQKSGKRLTGVLPDGFKVSDSDIKLGVVGILFYEGLHVLDDHVNLFLICGSIDHFGYFLPPTGKKSGKSHTGVLLSGFKVSDSDIILGVVDILFHEGIRDIFP